MKEQDFDFYHAVVTEPDGTQNILESFEIVKAPSNVKIQIDGDKNLNMPDDLTELTSTSMTGTTEDIYTWVKNQLDNTRYGLAPVTENNGDYTVVVSEVGSTIQ